MLYVIFSQDVENSLALRKQARPAHKSRLQALNEQGRLFVAGPNPAIDSEDPSEAGFTGSTVIADARGEGMQVAKTFLGLSLEMQRDVVLLLVEEHMCREILETLESVGEFDANPGSGIAFSIDVEDAVGVAHQVSQLSEIVEEEI